MNNKRVLQKATKELDKAKAPAVKKDIIVDPMGQWKYPGQVTRIPSNTITMQGVNYPVLSVPDKGQPVMMQPGAYYDFPEANYVDEYPQMKKGGGLNSKKYTRSIEGTNRLFAESDLFKKPKKLSKKRIFHPSAKYYQDGGEPINTSGPRNIIESDTIPEGTEMSPDYDLRSFYTEQPIAAEKFMSGKGHATDEYKLPNHPTFSTESRYSTVENPGGSWVEGGKGWSFNASHANRKNMSKEDMQKYFDEVEPDVKLNYIEADLTPEEIQQYAKGGYVVEDILDHKAKGGEACPEGYVWNETTKSCVPDEIIWAKDENDPIYQDYLIKQGLYDYSNYPNYSLREDAGYDLAEAARNGDLSKIKDFSNAEYYKGLIEDAQAHYNYQKERGAIDEETLQEYENKVLNANRSFYGSPETYTQIPNNQLKNDPNIKDPGSYGMFRDQKIDSFLAKYPPVNWTKKSSYTSIPFSPSYGWTGEEYGSSNHWTEPNTLFIEDKVDRKALKKIYPNMPDSYIDNYIEKQRKTPNYISNQWDPKYGYYDSPRLHDENGDYSLKTPTKTYTDKEGIKGYLQEHVNDDIEQYYRYLPSWNKPEKTVMFMPPPMDILPPGKIELTKGKLAGTAEEYLAPEYSTPNYKMDVPSYYKAHHNSSQLIPHVRLKRSETDARVTRPFAKLTQKVTGYNPKVMEGYEDEEGNWIPGEYEQAKQEGRKIEFQGLSSLKDKKAQEKYNTEYDKYLMATKYPQMMNDGIINKTYTNHDLTKNKRQEGGASGCPPGYTKVNGKCVSLNKKATAQDSLALYNNALALQKFYKNNNYKAKQLPLPVHAWEDIESARKHIANKRINSENIYGKELDLNDYYKPVDDYKFKQRDIPLPEKVTSSINGQGFIIGNSNGNHEGLGMMNTNAPMALYDARIKPNSFTRYDHKGDSKAHLRYVKYGKLKDKIKGHEDAAGVFSYDPISVKPSYLLTDKEVKERFKKYGPSGISQSRLEQLKLVPTKSNPKPKEHHYPKSETKTDNTKKPVPPGKTWQGDYTESSTLDPKTGKVITIKEPIYEDKLPIKEIERGELRPFVKTNYPPSSIEEEEVIPEEEMIESETTESGPDAIGADWVGRRERYIDWDGNNIGYNGIRFRKPGHGGDLIKKGRRHYLHYPSIESRYQAELVPEEPEEEYAIGGEFNEGDEVELTEAEVKRLRSLGYIIEEA
jgi:hypothetical protein